MKIGLVPGSFKPYHIGHDDLIRIAAKENDRVLVYSSQSDREDIKGSIMIQIMNKFIKPTLPKNVQMINVGVPVGALYQELEYAEENNSEDVYTIYSDAADIKKYNKKTMRKYAPKLVSNNQILTRPVERGVETTDVSGTKMRAYLKSGDTKNFAQFLPMSLQPYSAEIIAMFKNEMSENLLKVYLKEMLKECKILF